MDDKARRHKKSNIDQRRNKQAINYGQSAWRLVCGHKKSVITCMLLSMIVVLLLGVVGFLPVPTISAAPNGARTVDYTTLLKEITADDVVAVALQDNNVNAWLKEAHHTTENELDYLLWSQVVGVTNTSVSNTANPSPLNAKYAIYTQIAATDVASLMPLLESHHVEVHTRTALNNSDWLTLLTRFAPILLFIVLIILFMNHRKNQGNRPINDQLTKLGKSRGRLFERVKEQTPLRGSRGFNKSGASERTGNLTKSAAIEQSVIPSVTFDDVAGIDEVRAELIEIVQFLRSPERFNRLGARIPRGALLVGPPGTGKTLLAKAVAGEANVPFFSMSASEFVEMFVGVGASRVRDLFNQARRMAPCVIFLDEIDAVGRKRTMRASGSEERDQTLNQLLVEMDGFDARQAIVVLAATNRADILDAALLRPGRFDRRITVSPPDRAGREAILNVHSRRTPLHTNVSLERLARMTVGMTGADLANLVNEAALSAARRELEQVDHECFEEALARVQLGALRPLVMNEHERRIIAIHEGGHALVAYHSPEADTVNRVTILPRGQSLGVTQFTPETDRYNYSRETLMARIAVGLGGRVAEELTFGINRVTTGAENDLQVVTDLARRMVTRWGMSERVGVVFVDYRAEEGYGLNMRSIDPSSLFSQSRTLVADVYGDLHLNGSVPERQQWLTTPTSSLRPNAGGVVLSSIIDAEVQNILNEGYAMARSLLTRHNDQLILLASELVEHEQLDRAQFEALLKVTE